MFLPRSDDRSRRAFKEVAGGNHICYMPMSVGVSQAEGEFPSLLVKMSLVVSRDGFP